MTDIVKRLAHWERLEKLDALANDLREAKAEIESQRTENALLGKQVYNLRKQRLHANITIADLQAAAEEASATVDQRDREIERLRKRVAARDSTNKIMHALLEWKPPMTDIAERLRAPAPLAIELIDQERAEAADAIAARDAEIERLRAEIKELQELNRRS